MKDYLEYLSRDILGRLNNVFREILKSCGEFCLKIWGNREKEIICYMRGQPGVSTNGFRVIWGS